MLKPSQKESTPQPQSSCWRDWRVMLVASVCLMVFIYLGAHYGWNTRVVAGVTLLVGLVSGVFAWGLSLIGLLPLVGPLIVKVLSFGFIWVLNAIGYCISLIAIRRGYSKDVLTYRGLTIALLIGIVIGYVVAQFI